MMSMAMMFDAGSMGMMVIFPASASAVTSVAAISMPVWSVAVFISTVEVYLIGTPLFRRGCHQLVAFSWRFFGWQRCIFSGISSDALDECCRRKFYFPWSMFSFWKPCFY